MEKFTIEQAKANVENSFGSIYSKDDVLAILNSIQVKSEASESIGNITSEQFSDLASKITNKLIKSIENVECIDGWDLSINYNEVTVDMLSPNENEIEEIIEDTINEWVSNIKGEDDDCGC
jgi:hypothetical protein